MKYGERLRLAREQAGLSQEELASRTNGLVKQGSISKIERGDQKRSSFDIDLAIALDIHPKWLKDEDQRFSPEWFNPATCINFKEKPTAYTSTALTTNENKAIKLIRLMPHFQQNEWLTIGQTMADQTEMFRKALTTKSKIGDDS